MKCEVFTGTPGGVKYQVNNLFQELKDKGRGITLQSVTQSYEEVHGNMILTIIYNDWEDMSHAFSKEGETK